MQRFILSAAVVALLFVTGCGISVNTGGGSSNNAPTTSAAEVRALSETLRNLSQAEAQKGADKAACREGEGPSSGFSCFRQADEPTLLAMNETAAVIKALKPKVGAACRRALTEDRGDFAAGTASALNEKMIAACAADVGP